MFFSIELLYIIFTVVFRPFLIKFTCYLFYILFVLIFFRDFIFVHYIFFCNLTAYTSNIAFPFALSSADFFR